MSPGRDWDEPPDHALREASGLDSDQGILDRSTLRSIRGLGRPGEADPVRELCVMYLHDMSARIASAARAADSGDAAEVSYQAHAIKGAAGTFGAMRMYVVATRLEEVATSERARSVAAELLVELERVRSLVEKEILSPSLPPSGSD